MQPKIQCVHGLSAVSGHQLGMCQKSKLATCFIHQSYVTLFHCPWDCSLTLNNTRN